jgi:acyl transferase domain-containing protein
VAGDHDAVHAIAGRFRGEGRRIKALTVSHAFHSPHMDPVLEEFRRVAESVAYAEPTTPLVSNLTGEPADPEAIATAQYWVGHIRRPVRFHQGVRALHEQGTAHFLELGPDATLTTLVHNTLEPAGSTFAAVPVLRPERTDPVAFTTAIATLHTAGRTIAWPAPAAADAAPMPLPTYPFERRDYWLNPLSPTPATGASAGEPEDARFWAAVESGDLAALSAVLGIDASTPLGEVVPALAEWRRARRLRYRFQWKPVPVAATAPPGNWLVVLPENLAADPALSSAIAGVEHKGGRFRTLVVGSGAAGDLSELTARLREIATAAEQEQASAPGGAGLDGVFSLLDAASSALLISALQDSGVPGPLWLGSRAAVTVGSDSAPPDSGQARLWDLSRAVAAAHPELWGGVIDLPSVLDRRTAIRLVAALGHSGAERELAIRPTGLFARRLAPAPTPAEAQATTWEWDRDGAVLLTGASASTAGPAAELLAASGAVRVILVRSPRSDKHPDQHSDTDPEPSGTPAALPAAGGGETEIVEARCDIGDRRALRDLLETIGATSRIDAVVHVGFSAETTSDGSFQAAAGRLEEAADAVENVYEATRDLKLGAFLVLGSPAAAFGLASAAGTAPAYSSAEALVRRARAEGVNAVSLAWDGWTSAGGTSARPAAGAHAVSILTWALRYGTANLVAADPDRADLRPEIAAGQAGPLFDDVSPNGKQQHTDPLSPPPVDDAGPRPASELLARASAPERERILLDLLRRHAAEILGHGTSEDIDPDIPFPDLGFSSFTALELSNRLKTADGIILDPLAVFDHPTAAGLARHLRDQPAHDPATV